MKRNLILIAEGNASKSINAYNEEIRNSNWMDDVDEEAIYEAIGSPEFNLYMEILGLDEHKQQCNQVA